MPRSSMPCTRKAGIRRTMTSPRPPHFIAIHCISRDSLHQIIRFPPTRAVLAGKEKPQFPVAEFFVKGNPVTAHVILVALSPVARTSQNLTGRKNLVSDRADEVILDNLFIIW